MSVSVRRKGLTTAAGCREGRLGYFGYDRIAADLHGTGVDCWNAIGCIGESTFERQHGREAIERI
jgi:hypothetical protein